MAQPVLKSLHIIFVVTWFSSLFYIVRLFIYHVEAQRKPSPEKEILTKQFRIMEKRLWYGIAWPSAILSISFGISLLPNYWPLWDHPWLMVKLAMVFLLIIYHLDCGKILSELKKGGSPHTPFFLRVYNEIATLFLFSIVFLVVLKNTLNVALGILALSILSIALFFGIKIYNRQKHFSPD
jgi:putative membrane protein